MGVRASYLMHGSDGQRDALDYNPEHSRRARGFAVYAAIRALGRSGIAEMVERCCSLARRFADQLSAADGIEVLNDVVLNQVLVRLDAQDGDHDGHTYRGARTSATRGHVLDEWHEMEWPGGRTDIGVELVNQLR